MIERIHRLRYFLLLIALMLTLFGSVIAPFFDKEIFRSLFLLLTVFAAINLFPPGQSKRVVSILLIGVTLLIEILVSLDSVEIDFSGRQVFYSLFFLGVAIELFRQIFVSSKIDVDIIVAIFCGFLMIGVGGAFLFTLIESVEPGSFDGLDDRYTLFSEMLYFSFISELTIGYGDITPSTEMAKRASTLLGVIGQFYTTVLVAIVVGKFISNRESK